MRTRAQISASLSTSRIVFAFSYEQLCTIRADRSSGMIHIITLSECLSPRATRPPAIGWRPAHRRTARVRCPVPLLDRGFPTHVHSRRAPVSGEGWSRSPRRRSRLSQAPTRFRRSTSGQVMNRVNRGWIGEGAPSHELNSGQCALSRLLICVNTRPTLSLIHI